MAHPDSGSFREQHCDACVKEVGLRAVGPDWPSVYIHDGMRLILVIYVDDFKLAGPEGNLKRGGELLRTKLGIDPETPLGHYLGCDQRMMESKLSDSIRVKRIVYDMKFFMEQCVQCYLPIAGANTKMQQVGTPSIADSSGSDEARLEERRRTDSSFVHLSHTLRSD